MAQNPIVTITMEDGSVMKAELYPEIAPESVNNFVTLINQKFYDGLIFHRVISGFMIQGGDPLGQGYGGPGDSIKVIGDDLMEMRQLGPDEIRIGSGQLGNMDIFIIDLQIISLTEKLLRDINDRRAAQIVCPRLEGQSQDTDPALALALDDLQRVLLLDLVGGIDRLNDRRIDIVIVGQRPQSLGILGQAGATVGKARLEIVGRYI